MPVSYRNHAVMMPHPTLLQRAELKEQSAVSASQQSEVEMARLLSDVMEARRRLEEDADREVSEGLKARLEDAKDMAEVK